MFELMQKCECLCAQLMVCKMQTTHHAASQIALLDAITLADVPRISFRLCLLFNVF